MSGNAAKPYKKVALLESRAIRIKERFETVLRVAMPRYEQYITSKGQTFAAINLAQHGYKKLTRGQLAECITERATASRARKGFQKLPLTHAGEKLY